MGDRYHLTLTCKGCGFVNDDVYFAPTAGFTEYTCLQCGVLEDLVELTGITAEDASNIEIIGEMVDIISDATINTPPNFIGKILQAIMNFKDKHEALKVLRQFRSHPERFSTLDDFLTHLEVERIDDVDVIDTTI